MIWLIGGIIVIGFCAAVVYAALSVGADAEKRQEQRMADVNKWRWEP